MAHSTSETAFLTIEKSFTYRGAREHWDNVYHLDQIPTSSAQWQALGDLVAGKEQACLPSNVQIERYFGHTPGTPPVLVFELDQPPVGEGGPAGAYTPIATEHQVPGDGAIWVRYGTTQKTSLGKPIYLRNYYHCVFYDGAADTFSPRQATNFNAMAADWVAGINASGTTFRRAGPRGAVAQNHAVSTFITTRTLKRRGRRHRITQQQVVDWAKAHDVPFILGPAFE
jgi:hypothetical protein